MPKMITSKNDNKHSNKNYMYNPKIIIWNENCKMTHLKWSSDKILSEIITSKNEHNGLFWI
jgi:hypothetical protein